VIDSNQLDVALVMGVGLIALGLVPGLLQACADGISDVTNMVSLRLGTPMHSRAEFNDPHWFALSGVALILLALLAYLSN